MGETQRRSKRKRGPSVAEGEGEGAADGAAAQGTRAALDFEATLSRLEDVVQALEDGDLPLERALAVFEEGVGLTKRCAEQLQDTERRIEVLVAEGEALVARPFEAADEEA